MTNKELDTLAVFSHDGKWVAFGSRQRIQIFSMSSRACVYDIETNLPALALPRCFGFSGDSEEVLLPCYIPPEVHGDGEFTIPKLVDTLSWTGRIELPELSYLTSSAFSSDGKHVLLGDRDNTVHLYDRLSGAKKWSVPFGFMTSIDCSGTGAFATFSRNSRFILAASEDGELMTLDICGAVQQKFEGHTSGVIHAAFSPEGDKVVSASANGEARIWDSSSGECLYMLSGHASEVLMACFDEDGHIVVSTSADHSARLWSSRTGNCLHFLQGHESPVIDAFFSQDRKSLTTLDSDGTCRSWDLASGECVETLDPNGRAENNDKSRTELRITRGKQKPLTATMPDSIVMSTRSPFQSSQIVCYLASGSIELINL